MLIKALNTDAEHKISSKTISILVATETILCPEVLGGMLNLAPTTVCTAHIHANNWCLQFQSVCLDLVTNNSPVYQTLLP